MKPGISLDRYAALHNETTKFSKDETCTFVAIVFLFGYNARPRPWQHWSHDNDLTCSAFPRSMTRNRFEPIKRFLHFADNDSLPQGDKMAKIGPLQEAVNASLQQFGVLPRISQ